MNKYLSILAITIVVSAFSLVAGCDVVEEPYGPSGDGCIGSELFNDTVFSDTNENRRRIILEEFTGHKCPNCPEGADIAEQIKIDHPEDFLSVAVHNSGAFSKVDISNPDHPYPSNFETETGEKMRIKYQYSSFPGGMLNRTEINGSVKVDYSKWTQEVNALIADPDYMSPRFKLDLVNIYNSKLGERSVRVRYKVSCLQNVTGNIAIAAYVTESHIIAPQTDNRLSESYVADYEHNHVLRVGFPNNGDGKTVLTNPKIGDVAEVISDNEEICVSLSDDWVPENMEVIVFLFDSDTGEILHVEELPLSN